MVTYNMAAARSASDMDGIGTDLLSGDLVVTNAYKLTLDIDCGWEKITVSNNGELQIDGHIFSVDDVDDAGVVAQAGSIISSPNLTKALRATFRNKFNKYGRPLFPYQFTVLGTMTLSSFCTLFGNKFSMFNSNYTLEFPFGQVQATKPGTSVFKQNNIQGAVSVHKPLGYDAKSVTLKGIIFNADMYIEDHLIEMLESNEAFSLVTDRIHLEACHIVNFRPTRRFQELLEFVMTVVEV